MSTSRPEDPELPGRLAELGYALRLDFARTSEPAVLDKAIMANRRALELCPAKDPNRADILSHLTITLIAGAMSKEEPALAEEAVEVGREATTRSERDDPQRPTRLSNLALALQTRHHRTGNVDDVREATDLLREAIRTTDPRDPHMPLMLSNLGYSLLLGDRDDIDDTMLDEAVSALEQATASTPPEHTNYARCQMGLANALHLRWTRDGEPTVLDRVIEAARTAVDATPENHLVLPTWLASLAEARYEESSLRRRLDSVDEAIETYRRLLGLTPEDDPRRAARLLALADLLHVRFRLTAEASALTEAVDTARAALRSETLDQRSRAAAKLSAILIDLATVTGGDELSLEAATILRDVLRDSTLEPATQTRAWTNLGFVLEMRHPLLEHHRRTGRLDSLTEAVEIGERAVEATPDGHPSLGDRLSNLGLVLSARYDRTSEPADLEAALEVHRRAVDLTPAGHPGRGRMLANLSAGLSNHYRLTGDRDSIESAVHVAREAVNATPDGHPSKPLRLIALAVALVELCHRTGERPLVLEAVRVAEVAAASAAATPSTRLRAARVWGRLAAVTDQWETAAAAFGQGVRLLSLVAPRNLHRSDLEHQLVEVDRIASNAAASAVWAGDAAGALEMLEQGRGVLLSYALDSRSELTDLRAAAPELAAEWETLGKELDTATAAPDEMPSDEAVPVPDPDHRHGLAQRWQSLLSRIRATAGFERFLEPPVLADLRPAAASGAVVTVNVSDLRCDALVLTADRVRVVPLPDLDTEKLDIQVHTFLEALDVPGMGDSAHDASGASAAATPVRR